MGFPSITIVLSSIFAVYVAYSIWTMSQLFSSLKCSGTPCFTSYLSTNPKLQVVLFTSEMPNPLSGQVTEVAAFANFDYHQSFDRHLDIKLPAKARNNGTLYLHVVLASDSAPFKWQQLQRDGLTVMQRISLTEYMVPKAATFNLLGGNGTESDIKSQNSNTQSNVKTVSHWKPKVYVSILTDDISMSHAEIPPEFGRLLRVNQKHEFLPILQNDFLKTRLHDLEEITKNSTKLPLSFHYAPIGIGKLRLLLHVEHAMNSLKKFGFSNKDVDEVKGIFSDTNLYLLCGTIFIGSVHVLFDFLSFKNDIAFWRRKKTYIGLSVRTTLWRAFSQIVIFLYLLDENTSMLILIPAGMGTLIELWKCKKILKLNISLSGIKVSTVTESESVLKAEQLTRDIDREGMRYLSYLLYPLCTLGAIYSLVYQPHKSWYSWTLNSLVNGVYAFGFLFMLPQLFVNYKMKSVAALPWRSFMYKAFNTFIDDIFAFIITMPTAHRLACFRDDIVFVIYLYQRWLYPVDKSRLDDGTDVVAHLTEAEQKAAIDNSEEKKTN